MQKEELRGEEKICRRKSYGTRSGQVEGRDKGQGWNSGGSEKGRVKIRE